ncbi:MAG: hypothetical protein AVDCRST_MAG73-2070, partial [uncultured Thermomicrobiales bacterium]
ERGRPGGQTRIGCQFRPLYSPSFEVLPNHRCPRQREEATMSDVL